MYANRGKIFCHVYAYSIDEIKFLIKLKKKDYIIKLKKN